MNEWTGAKIYDMVGLKCRWTMVCEWMSRRRDGQMGKKTWTWIDNKPVDRLVDGRAAEQTGR